MKNRVQLSTWLNLWNMVLILLAMPMWFAGVSGYGECARHVLVEEDSLSKSGYECLLSSNVLSSQFVSMHQNKESQKILTKVLPHKIINMAVPNCLIVTHIGTSYHGANNSLDAIVSCKLGNT